MIFGGDISVQITPRRDYLYRALIARDRVARAAFDCVVGIQYGNFKNSIAGHGPAQAAYREACGEVWGVMERLQYSR